MHDNNLIYTTTRDVLRVLGKAASHWKIIAYTGVPRMERVHGGGSINFPKRGLAMRSGRQQSPGGVQGHSPGRSPPEAEAKCEISVQFF